MTINSGPGRYVLFGHPVSHSWSPFIHGLFARQFDHVMDYKVMDTAPAAFVTHEGSRPSSANATRCRSVAV